jgi:hypothetical protein
VSVSQCWIHALTVCALGMLHSIVVHDGLLAYRWSQQLCARSPHQQLAASCTWVNTGP